MKWADRQQVFSTPPNHNSNPYPTPDPPSTKNKNKHTHTHTHTHTHSLTSPIIYPSLHDNFTPKPPNPLHPIPHPITIPHLRPPRSSPHCRHASRTLFFHLFSNIKIIFFLYFFLPRARRMGTAGTEVALMMMANSMVFFALIGTVEGTRLVSTIMSVRAAIGSGITRTGQSSVNGTTK